MAATDDPVKTHGEALAARTGGALVSAPPRSHPHQRPQWALVLPRGLHAALLTHTSSGPLVLPSDGSTLPDDPAAAARALAAHATCDDVTTLELASAVCARLERELDHPTWLHPVVSGRRLTQLYLHGEAFYAHTVELGRAAPRAELGARVERLFSEVRGRVLAFRAAEPRARELGELAGALVRLLVETVPTPDGSAWRMRPFDLRRLPASIEWGAGPGRAIAAIAMPGVFVIGDREQSIARLDLPAMRDAIARRLGQVTRDRLEPGIRYRVLAPFAGTSVGDELAYLRTEWVDDEYPVPVFEDASGAPVRLEDGRVLLALEHHLAFVTG